MSLTRTGSCRVSEDIDDDPPSHRPEAEDSHLFQRFRDKSLRHHRLRFVRHPFDEKGVYASLRLFRQNDFNEIPFFYLDPLGKRSFQPLVHRFEGKHRRRELTPFSRLEYPRLRRLCDGIDLGEILDRPFQIRLSRNDLFKEGLRRHQKVAVRGNQPVDNPHLVGLRGRQHRPLQDQFESAITDQPGQALRPSGAGKQADIALRQADESRLPLLGDPPGAGEGEFQAASEAVAVDGRNGGNAQGAQTVEGGVKTADGP